MKFDEVNEALDWLESQEDIPKALEGYPGVKCNNWKCPIANFVLSTTDIAVNVGVYWVEDRNGSGGGYRLGENLLSFKDKFDEGDYPHLVQK